MVRVCLTGGCCHAVSTWLCHCIRPQPVAVPVRCILAGTGRRQCGKRSPSPWDCDRWSLIWNWSPSLGLLVFPCALGDVVRAKRSARCLPGKGGWTPAALFLFCPSPAFLHAMVIVPYASRGPFPDENTRLCWPRLLQGPVKRPLCVSFKTGLCFVSPALCKGTGQQLLAAGQAGPRELWGQASASRLSGSPPAAA